MCHVSDVIYHVSCVTATAMDPPPANSNTMQSRMVCEDPKIYIFSAGLFKTISESKLQIRRPMFIYHFFLQYILLF